MLLLLRLHLYPYIFLIVLLSDNIGLLILHVYNKQSVVHILIKSSNKGPT